MGLVVRRLRNGSTTAVTLTLKDQDGNNISLAGGSLSALLTPTSGSSVWTSGALTTSASGIGTITISGGTLSNLSGLNNSGLVPFDLHCDARFITSGSTTYREGFTVPIHPRDGEWVYGLTTLGYAREYLGIADTASDALLIKAIRGMSQRIRRMCGRDKSNGFKSGTFTEEFYGPVAGELPLTENPITAISSVTERWAGSTQRTLASTEYEITSDGKYLRLFGSTGAYWSTGGYASPYTYPSQRLSRSVSRFEQRSLRVAYTGGYTVVPPDLEEIALEAIAQQWANKGLNRGLQSETLGNYAYTRRSVDDVDKWLTDALRDGGWISGKGDGERMSVAGLLNLTCRRRALTNTQNTTTGGITPSFTNTTGVRCTVQTMNSSEGVLQDAERGTRVYNVYFAYNQTIAVGDHIDTISPGTEWSGRTLAIHSPPTDDAGRKAYIRCEAVEVGGGAQL